MNDLRATVRKFAARLREQFESEIERDTRGFKCRVVTLLKESLPPGPGRPCTEIVTRATSMRAQGRSWQEIYAGCLLHVEGGSDSRQIAQSRLRSAVRARRNSARRRRRAGTV